MIIQRIPVTSINPAPYNPRIVLKPSDPEYQKLKQSISTFGYVEPLVWNQRTGTLVSGHQRLNVLLESSPSEIEVSVVDLPLEKEKSLNLALNRIRGEWDDEKLSKLLEELQAVPDLDISLTGFDMPEISMIRDRFLEPNLDSDASFEDRVAANEAPSTKRGDLIVLGEHRILCGDSSNPDDLKRLLGEERPMLLHTDPPYNVSYYGGNRPSVDTRPKASREWERIYFDNLSQDEYEIWFKKVMANVLSCLNEDASLYIWNGHRQFGPMYQMLTDLGVKTSCVITWAKPSFAIGYGDYNQQTEFCLYGWRSGGRHKWYGENNASTLWQIDRDPTKDYIHPTQKPTEIAERAIKNSSQRGDIVLDMFLGSGSTLIAADRLFRRCYGMEIDERYVDAIVQRYAAMVGTENLPETVRNKYFAER